MMRVGRYPLARAARSASTIMRISSSKPISGFQPSRSLRLGRIADQQVDFGGPEELLVDDDVVLPVQAHLVEGDLAQLPHRVGLAGGDDVVVRLVLLQHQPHGPDVVAGEAPVPLGVQVAERHLRCRPSLMAAALKVTFRVTNSRPRRGLSWLNRMPELACSP